jgi:hypothetical protein
MAIFDNVKMPELYCDKCGKRIDPILWHKHFTRNGKNVYYHEDCYKALDPKPVDLKPVE